MTKEIIHPTGTCFDDVSHWIIQQAFKGILKPHHYDTPSYRICHGICAFPSGELYAHCWIEAGGACFDGRKLKGEIIMVEYERKTFYKLMRVKETYKYTLKEATECETRFGYPGPWEMKVRRLCRDFKRQSETLSGPRVSLYPPSTSKTLL